MRKMLVSLEVKKYCSEIYNLSSAGSLICITFH